MNPGSSLMRRAFERTSPASPRPRRATSRTRAKRERTNPVSFARAGAMSSTWPLPPPLGVPSHLHGKLPPQLPQHKIVTKEPERGKSVASPGTSARRSRAEEEGNMKGQDEKEARPGRLVASAAERRLARGKKTPPVILNES